MRITVDVGLMSAIDGSPALRTSPKIRGPRPKGMSLDGGITYIQGAAPHTMEGVIELGQRDGLRAATTVSILPPGKWLAWIYGGHWGGQMGTRPGIDIAFSDRAASNWIRRATGELEELETSPTSHFTKHGFAPPHAWNPPETIQMGAECERSGGDG